ncbi:MAG: class I SAM-dependent methyltransferase [Thermomonas sp.]
MLLCPACRQQIDSFDAPCIACGHAVPVRNGMKMLAPELQGEAIHFDPTAFETIIAVEETSFWFQGRNELIAAMSKRYCPDSGRILEIGCGSGVVLSRLARTFPGAGIVGTEAHIAGLDSAAGRVRDATLMQMDARDIPFRDEFDLVGIFDVLEHIDDDRQVLGQILQSLKPGGMLIATVPQHQSLWSEADDRAGHVRRYSGRELRDKIAEAGFEPIRQTSFVTLLFPAMIYARKFRSGAKRNERGSEFKISRGTNSMLRHAMDLERGILKLGIDLPFGGSLIAVARKPS